MPMFVVSVDSKADFNEVLENIKKVSGDIVILGATPNKRSKRSSGLATIECSDEIAEKVKEVKGVRHFEPRIIHSI